MLVRIPIVCFKFLVVRTDSKIILYIKETNEIVLKRGSIWTNDYKLAKIWCCRPVYNVIVIVSRWIDPPSFILGARLETVYLVCYEICNQLIAVKDRTVNIELEKIRDIKNRCLCGYSFLRSVIEIILPSYFFQLFLYIVFTHTPTR